jgi:ArsR family transcriptional regulator
MKRGALIDNCQYVWHTGRMTTSAALPIADLAVCCAPLTGSVIEPAAAAQVARAFKALGDPTRVRLLSLIAAHEGAEACVCDLIDPVGLSQPTVSHHLKQLVDAGLLTRQQRGKWAYYRLVQPALDALASTIRGPAR